MNYKDILLCSEDTIKTITNINDNIAGDYLTPAIYVAQKSNLEGILGTALVRAIQRLIVEDKLNLEANKHYKELLDDYITDYLSYAAICEVIPIVSFKIGNTGAARTDEEKTTSLSFNEVFKLKDWYEDKMNYFGYRMQRYLIDNYNLFPELNDSTISNIKHNLYSAADCPIFLGGERAKK